MLEEPYKFVLDLFARTPPLVQAIFLLALGYAVVHLAVRKRSLKNDLRQRDLTIREHMLDLERAKTQLADAERIAASLSSDNGDLKRQVGSLEERLATGEKETTKARRQLAHCQEERMSLEERFQQIEQIDADIWCRSIAADFSLARLAPRDRRRAILVAVQNLKGGVGKTTLVANLGAAYATCVLGEPRRVLLVDLDFQGTLSNRCVEEEHLRHRRTNELTSARLLSDEAVAPAQLLDLLASPIPNTSGRGNAIVAWESLEHHDFRQQACFVVRGQEVRFQHRRFFHDPGVPRDRPLLCREPSDRRVSAGP